MDLPLRALPELLVNDDKITDDFLFPYVNHNSSVFIERKESEGKKKGFLFFFVYFLLVII